MNKLIVALFLWSKRTTSFGLFSVADTLAQRKHALLRRATTAHALCIAFMALPTRLLSLLCTIVLQYVPCFVFCTSLLYLCTFVCFFCVCEFYRFESSDQRSLLDTAYHVRATLNPSYWRNCAMNSYQHHTSPLASHATTAISVEYHQHRTMRGACPTPVSDRASPTSPENPPWTHVGVRGSAGGILTILHVAPPCNALCNQRDRS